MFVNFQNVFNAKSNFEIRRSSARVYLDPQQFTYKSLSSPKRLKWNITARVYVIL